MRAKGWGEGWGLRCGDLRVGAEGWGLRGGD